MVGVAPPGVCWKGPEFVLQTGGKVEPGPGREVVLSNRMYLLIGFRKSTPQQNRHVNLIFQLAIVNNKLTVLWWSWLSKTNP